jgi:hypothetical protein
VSFLYLLQIFINIVLFSVVGILWMKLSRPQKDDPRLSKGLQLLQSKISVLEDLSDRTETQVRQLTALIEGKIKDVQTSLQTSEKQLAKIEKATQKSMEVAKIFQDRIPHDEIIERRNSMKYIKAARLANQGLSADEIAKQVDLSTGEIDFIAKVNKEQLMFCEESLPEWANQELDENDYDFADGVDEVSFMPPIQRGVPRDLSSAFEIPKNDTTALDKLGKAFKDACNEVPQEMVQEVVNQKANSGTGSGFLDINDLIGKKNNDLMESIAIDKSVVRPANLGQPSEKKLNLSGVRPVEFRRIELVKDLE